MMIFGIGITGITAALLIALIAATATPAQAQKSSIKINEKTKYYRIKGKSAAEFALSMRKKGHYSRQHRHRAWATASRDLTYQLHHQKSKNRFKIKGVKVRMKITYEMPKLSSTSGVSKRQRRVIGSACMGCSTSMSVPMACTTNSLPRRVYASLRKLKSQRSCAALERSASKLVAKLGKADKKRNVDFDRRDRRNYRSM